MPKNPPPIKITPDRNGIVGSDTIVISEGNQAYHIDLAAFIQYVNIGGLTTKWQEKQYLDIPGLAERLAEIKQNLINSDDK